MTKRAKAATPDPSDTNARATLLAEWIAHIETGKTERGAAIEVRAKYPGIQLTFSQLSGWARRDPVWADRLELAHERKVGAHLAVVESVAAGEVEDGSLARAQLAAATWMLSKLRPSEFADRQKVEQTGKDGGPIETRSEVAVYRRPANPIIDGEDG